MPNKYTFNAQKIHTFEMHILVGVAWKLFFGENYSEDKQYNSHDIDRSYNTSAYCLPVTILSSGSREQSSSSLIIIDYQFDTLQSLVYTPIMPLKSYQ